MNLKTICIVGVGILISVVYFFANPGYGPMVKHGNYEIYYVEGATKDDATRAAEALAKNSPFEHRTSGQLKKKTDGFVYRAVIKNEFQNDEKTHRGLEIDATRLSRDGFNGLPIEIDVCDDKFRTIKSLPPRADIRYGVIDNKAEVFFAKAEEKEDAVRLAGHFAEQTKNSPTVVSFKLAHRDPKTVEVHVSFKKELIADPNIDTTLQADIRDLKEKVFPGRDVELHLTDEFFDVARVVKANPTPPPTKKDGLERR